MAEQVQTKEVRVSLQELLVLLREKLHLPVEAMEDGVLIEVLRMEDGIPRRTPVGPLGDTLVFSWATSLGPILDSSPK